MWQCASIRPGMMVMPVASKTEAGFSKEESPEKTAAMRPSSPMRTVAFFSGASPLAAMRVPPRISNIDGVELLHVVESHFPPLFGRKRAHDLLDLLVGPRVGTGRVREIRAPHDAIDADL